MQAPARFQFSDAHRERLARLQVLPQQIEHLEQCLPICDALLRKPAPLQDVRDELLSIEAAALKAYKSVVRLTRKTRTLPAVFEAQQRLRFAAAKVVDGRRSGMHDVRRGLITAIRAARVAISDLGGEQRRKVTGSTLPIRSIDDALMAGFIAAHPDTSRAPIYNVSPSSAPKSKFRLIVGVCYEAIRADTEDPERALRSYMDDRNKRDASAEQEREMWERPDGTPDSPQ